MRVSVVIPLYNKADHIQRCLESIAAQSYGDFEVIVVDDGSTDNGSEIVRDFRDSRIWILEQPNAGPGAARNRGVAAAQGELLAFLDADDEWLPNYLRQNVKALDESGPEVASVSSGYLEWPAGKNTEPMWRDRGLREGIFRATPQTDPMLLVHALAYMSCWNTVISAAVFNRFGGFFSRERALYAEDAWLWLQVLLNYPVLFRFEPLTRYHREASDLTANEGKARPVEPFLVRPEEIEENCPPPMRDLLRKALAIRAMKTACVLGYWGDWTRARQLRNRFTGAGDRGLPYFYPSLVCSTWLGALLGRAHRSLRVTRRG